MPDNYGTVAGYRLYFEARGVDVSDHEDEEIQSSLLIGSEWLDGKYRTNYPGLKVGGRDQIREWPRNSAQDFYGYSIPSNSVPREIDNATYELAYRNLETPGILFIDYTPGKYKSASIDGAISVTFANISGAVDIQRQFPIVDQIIAGLMIGSGSFSSLSSSSVRV